MTTYLARVELRGNPSGETYQHLHKAMESVLYYRSFFWNGRQFFLPHATYVCTEASSGLVLGQREIIVSVASSIDPDPPPQVFVVEFEDAAWQLQFRD